MRLTILSALFVAAAVAMPHGGAKKVSLLQIRCPHRSALLTLIAGNAETCYHFNADINVNADEEGHGASCWLVHVYVNANEAEYEAPCHFIYVHADAYEARDLHGSCNSYFFDES